MSLFISLQTFKNKANLKVDNLEKSSICVCVCVCMCYRQRVKKKKKK